MSAEENKAIVRRVEEEMWNKGNLDLAEEFFASEFVGHDPASPEEIHGPEGHKQFVAAARSALPDLHFRIEDQLAERDRVATRYVITGTQDGELAGIPPTGKRVEVEGVGVDYFSGGKIAEPWGYYDVMGMMQQLGVIRYPEEPARG